MTVSWLHYTSKTVKLPFITILCFHAFAEIHAALIASRLYRTPTSQDLTLQSFVATSLRERLASNGTTSHHAVAYLLSTAHYRTAR